MEKIYHIVNRLVYEKQIIKNGFYRPPSVREEGYIHCSFRQQVCLIGNMFYPDDPDPILLEIDSDLTGCEVKVEDLSKLNQPFPHIYGKLLLQAVTAVYDFPRGPDGKYILPELL